MTETKTFEITYPRYMFRRDPFRGLTMQDKVKISEEKPPVWDNVVSWLGFIPGDAIFTYGDTIYNPNKVQLADQLIVHESVHMGQHNYNNTDAALWWGKYMRDTAFRIQQETEAYAVQYSWLCHYVKGYEQRHDLLIQLARILAGPLYGSAIGFIDAMTAIREKSGVR